MSKASGSVARLKLLQDAMINGMARSGNYEIYRNTDGTISFMYRGKLVTVYNTKDGSIAHAENEHAGTPRTKNLQLSNENAVYLWKRAQKAYGGVEQRGGQ